MTIDDFLKELEVLQADWFISPEGYLRVFVEPVDPNDVTKEVLWDWVVGAMCRVHGRTYSFHEYKKAGRYLGLSDRDVELIKAADQNRPEARALREELERICLAPRHQQQAQDAQDGKIEEVMESLKTPWQREEGREEEEWNTWLKKQQE